jgi:hypothetical protein
MVQLFLQCLPETFFAPMNTCRAMPPMHAQMCEGSRVKAHYFDPNLTKTETCTQILLKLQHQTSLKFIQCLWGCFMCTRRWMDGRTART